MARFIIMCTSTPVGAMSALRNTPPISIAMTLRLSAAAMAAIASTDDVVRVGEKRSFVLLVASSYESCLESLERARRQILVFVEHGGPDDGTALLLGQVLSVNTVRH
jgi:hypothetical protein